MFSRHIRYWVPFTLCLLFSGSVLAQKKDDKNKNAGTPVMWEAVAVADRDLLLGPGGEDMKPDLSRVTFVRDEKGGFSKKYRIKDGSGHTWVAKIGAEAQSETAAVRLLWAIGYKTEINYLVPELTIPGKGSFTQRQARGTARRCKTPRPVAVERQSVQRDQ